MCRPGDQQLLHSFLTDIYNYYHTVGAAWIEQEELRISRYAQSRLTANRWITLLGRTGGWVGPEGEAGMHHLPIFSFLIQRGSRFLHHNFVCALLNDLFGIQSRGKEVTRASKPLSLFTPPMHAMDCCHRSYSVTTVPGPHLLYFALLCRSRLENVFLSK